MDKFKRYLQHIVPMSEKEFTDSIAYFHAITLQKGAYFVRQEKVCRHVGFIIQGTLRSFYINHKSEEVTACFCTQNSFSTSYKSFILQQPSTLSIQALEDTSLLVIDYDDLQTLFKTSTSWQQLGRLVAEKEYLVMEAYASVLNNETAKEKYLRLLQTQPDVVQKATVENIASYLGVTRRTLSRIRQEISKQSL